MRYEHIKQTTRRLRHQATPEEKKLWKYLRRKQLKGRKFLRQHAIVYESVGDEHFSLFLTFTVSKKILPLNSMEKSTNSTKNEMKGAKRY